MNKGIILSPEVFDILNKLMKSDEDNATGDVQLLCKLFSGERCSYHYSTEESRVIPANTPFSILGATQLLNVAKLIAKMDHGHGLVDRFLLAFPLAFRPTLTEMETATNYLETEVVDDFQECFKNVYDHGQLHFTFDEDAQQLLRHNIDQFVAEVNEAIREVKMPPKSKMPELVPRMAAALHVLNHTMNNLLAGVPASLPPTEISKSTLENATEFVQHLETQKGILCQFLKDLTNATCDKTIEQPTIDTVKDNVLLAQGPVVSFRSFKHGKRSNKAIAEPEFSSATKSLQEDGFGRVVEFNIPRSRGKCKVFVKSKPQQWPSTTSVSSEEFDNAFAKGIHCDISQPMRVFLQSNNYI
ncbi:uncharacterized protein LOC144657989 [Oculina patagonica]